MSKKHSLLSRYLSHVEQSPKHVQHIHALFFSSSVTFLLAAGILYFDYGFWHERYNKDEPITLEEKIASGTRSPSTMFSDFLKEAEEKLGTIKGGGSALLEGKKSYSNKEEFLTASSTKSEDVEP